MPLDIWALLLTISPSSIMEYILTDPAEAESVSFMTSRSLFPVAVHIGRGVFGIIGCKHQLRLKIMKGIDTQRLERGTQLPADDELLKAVPVHVVIGDAVDGCAVALDFRRLLVGTVRIAENHNFQGLVPRTS